MNIMTAGSEQTTILDLPMSALFERIAEARPDAVALEAGEIRLTYGALDAAANQVAHGLRAVGIGPEVPVGICLERSATWVVVALGVLKAGGVYVHVEPSYPPTRVAWLAADAKVRVVVSARQWAGVLTGVSVPVLWTDEPAWAEAPEARVASGAGPDNLACVIYTSGSTGQPKGVGVPHRGVARLVLDTDYVQLGPAEVLLQFAPLAFDASTFEVWGALLTGARLVIAPAGPVALRELGQVVQEREVTTLLLTTALFTQMVEHELAALSGVWQMVVGGEVMPVEAARRLLTAYPAMRVLNCYGPTENTTISCCHPVEVEDLSRPRLPVGQPIAHSTGYVVTPAGELAPAGVAGELYVGGAGLARGYVGQGGLTAARFVPDEFSGTPGARLYRTGDQVRWLADGVLEFLGRFDTQVKVRGFRVEPGEVEAALRQQGGVQAAAVVARGRGGGGYELEAFLVGSRPGVIEVGEVREALRKTLPEYMVPMRFVILEQLPLTPNGKIDRHALVASVGIEHEPPVDRLSSIEPTCTPIEEVLGPIWAQVLNVDTVDRDQDFFHLGGDSLAAMAIVAHVRRSLRVDIPLRLLFEHPTVAALAREIEKHNRANGRHASGSIPLIARRGPLPLTLAQGRVWLLHRLDPAGLAYTAHATFTFKGNLKPDVLEKSLQAIVQRHEIYRTTFTLRGGELSATVHRKLKPFPFRIVHLESLADNHRENRCDALIQAEIRTPFELGHLPLARWTLFRLSDRHHVLLHTEHHIVHDGWSFNVLVDELFECYRAFARGEVPVLEPVSVQCVDFAAWERQQQSSEQTRDDIKYWARQLAGASSDLHLPYDRDRPSLFTFAGSALQLLIPESLYAHVRTFARNETVSEFAIFFAAFVALLRLYGNSEVCIGVGVANRRAHEVQRTVGMLINTIVLRIDAAPDRTLRELVRDCWSIALEGYGRQGAPLNEVVRAVHPSRDPGQNPLYRVMFSAHDTPVQNVDIPGLSIELCEGLNNGSAKVDLNVIVIPPIKEGGSLARMGDAGVAVINWEYNTDVFDATTVRRLGTHYQAVLQQMTSAPDRRVSELAPMLAEEWAKSAPSTLTVGAHQPDLPMSALFERMAEERPEAVAVEAGETRLTYAALDAEANKVAHGLRAVGVGPEVPVGICLERSATWVVVALGVLKAGGAYVHLEPSYPPTRVAWLAADANVRVVVSARQCAGALAGISAPVLWADEPGWAEEPETRVASGAGPDHLACVIYTSGSTGRPKGVGVPHRGVARLVLETDYVQLGPAEVLLQFAPLGFDASTFEVWGALLTGARLVIAPAAPVALRELGQVVQERGVTTLWLTAGLFAQMVERELAALGGVRQMVVGGDVVPVEAVRRLLTAYPGMRVINGYGPTENTTFSCCHSIEVEDLSQSRLPIGQPIAHSLGYVVTPTGDLAPEGVSGELYVGGAGLARGYVGQGGLTAARFVPDEFSGTPGARLYRTGDRVRWLGGGVLEFLGRFDTQVKVRGFRVEPGEVEAALREHPGVETAAVVARRRAEGGYDLVACLVGSTPGAIEVADVRERLRGKLPEYMVPARILMLDQLPLTPNGKIDRNALVDLPNVRPSDQMSTSPLGTTEQMVLAQTFCKLLHVDSLSFTENLFDLGCDSLMMMKAHSILLESFPHLTLIDMFRYPTLASLAEHLTGTGSQVYKWARFKDRVTRHKVTTGRTEVSDRPRRRP
jgi:amino acid adenylation domain-containing protein